MPELPEVQTIVDDLNKKIKGKTFRGILYCDAKKLIRGISFDGFKKEIKGKKIRKVERRAKNILIYLSGGKILAIHLKMTGHLLIVKSRKLKVKSGKWTGVSFPEELRDPKNQFIHLVFELSDGVIMAYSDLRKFGEIRLVNRDHLASLEAKLGPEPLDPKFDLDALNGILDASRGKIKAVLMDQSKIAGIGNIYADEILFEAGVRPDRPTQGLKNKEIEKIHAAIKKILKKAVEMRGTSDSDYRDTSGKAGNFQNLLNVYRRTGKRCLCKKEDIIKIKIGQRSAHYCPKCQK
jgi:formamidopyrimidine-DNA glycosylase